MTNLEYLMFHLSKFVVDPLKNWKDYPCILWDRGKFASGYGEVWDGKKNRRSHRIAYEMFFGKIPSGLVPDHLCRNRACFCPTHIEPVTNGENSRRSPIVGHHWIGELAGKRQKAKTHCPQGHPYSVDNTWSTVRGRKCKQCDRERQRAKSEEKRTRKRGIKQLPISV
jgi:hypothetical protein